MPQKYSNHSFDEDLKKKLLEIGQRELTDQLGIIPSVPAVVRYLIKHYEQTTPKKGKQ